MGSPLLTDVTGAARELLRAAGYGTKGNRFCLQSNCNIAVIAFQRSNSNTAERTEFTINLGVFCNRISRILNGEEKRSPAIPECHLRERIGWLLPVRKDYWWTIDGSTDAAALGQELRSVIQDIGLPYLSRYSTDDALRDLWTRGSSPGLTDMQRLMYLSAISKANGWQESFRAACEELRETSRGKPHAAAAEAHIRKLEAS